MCVIIYKKESVNIGLDTLLMARNTNPDGLGLAYFDDKGVTYERILKPTKKDLQSCISKTKNRVAVFHFRIATSGGVNLRNCQPIYNEQGNFLLFHNGIINSLNGISKTESDTVLLSYILQNSESDKHQILEKLSERTFSKFVLIDDNNKIFLYGDYKDFKGLQCSNLNFVPRPPMPKMSPVKEAVFKTYDDFFKDRRTRWEDDLLITDDI